MIPNTPKGARTTAVLALSAVIALVTPTLVQPMPRFIWNASESVPIGLYYVSKRQPKLGEIGVIKPAEWVQLYAFEREYLPEKAWLLKPVFAVPPSTVCRFGSQVFVNGKHVAKAKIMDEKRRQLPVWKGCIELTFDEAFVLAKPRASFDSRYFGPVQREQIVGTAIPLSVVEK